ncbi:hypothetical protein LAZ67_23001776 [Cordylochernes scorpioides]|uniref:DUF7799 domain-containing protein n=1 Tax=Cordylochernes scorpioides TaxID=51811 RepID=A0ABY6LSW9_9ARAC|nr:hypothetical protein LAZ67_23001776 [Cordylochernes scorpioides]
MPCVRQSKEWLELKVQEMRPNITEVGHTLEEAIQLLNQHRQVLEKLKTKQSPVEELLRQADEMIARQQPKAELYSAMAANLGAAWSDLNSLLETRRMILELAVDFHTQARQFSEKMDEAQNLFSDLYLPPDVESCKSLLQKHLDEKKSLLEMSMGTLTAGQAVLERLREVGTSSMGDARPDHLRPLAQLTADEVERLTENLHDRRRHLEMLWARRKTRLEQCLQRCMLMHDIEQIEAASPALIVLENKDTSASKSFYYLNVSSKILCPRQEHGKATREAPDEDKRFLTKRLVWLVAEWYCRYNDKWRSIKAKVDSLSPIKMDVKTRCHLF